MKQKQVMLSESTGDEEPPQSKHNLSAERSLFIEEEESSFSFYPYYFQTILTKKQQNYYSSNGHVDLIKNLKLQIISQMDECKSLWNEFSPNLTLFDTWDFRYAFWKGYKHKLYFILLKENYDNFALLPLWYEEDKQTYTWFGSNWQEENKFFSKDPLGIPLLLAICPQPAKLHAISAQMPFWSKEVISFLEDDPKFVLNLKRINSVDDYLSTLKKKKRYNLRRDKRIIENQNPKILINNYQHFKSLVHLSIKRFHAKGEDADWEDPRRVETFRNVIKAGSDNHGQFKVRMISVIINNKIAAVDLIVLYHGCYYPLKCGYDVSNFPGIGNFVNLYEIEDALNLGMKKMDFLEISYGWKEKWFEAIPLLRYEKRMSSRNGTG